MPNPIVVSRIMISSASIFPTFPDAIGLLCFSGCSLSFFLSA